MNRMTVLLVLILAMSDPLRAQGVWIGDPYKQVYTTLRGGSYQEIARRADGGRQELVAKRKETADGKEVTIQECYGFTKSGVLKSIETHYFCSDEAWLKGFTMGIHRRFTSEWGQAQYDSQKNLHYWVTSAEGDLMMAGNRIDPQRRSKCFSILYTRQNLLDE